MALLRKLPMNSGTITTEIPSAFPVTAGILTLQHLVSFVSAGPELNRLGKWTLPFCKKSNPALQVVSGGIRGLRFWTFHELQGANAQFLFSR